MIFDDKVKLGLLLKQSGLKSLEELNRLNEQLEAHFQRLKEKAK